MANIDTDNKTPKKYSDAMRIVSEAMRSLGIDSKYMGVAIQWLFEAQTEIGVSVQFESKQAKIRIEDCKAVKPCDYITLESVVIGDNCIVPHFIPTSPLLVVGRCPNTTIGRFNGGYVINEQDFEFHVSSNANGLDMLVRYKAYRFDELGYPIVDRAYTQAIHSYIRYKYIAMARTMANGQFTAGDEQMARQNFITEARRGRGRKRSEVMNHIVLAQVASRWRNPYYVSQNPYIQADENNNTAFGVLSGGYSGIENSGSYF